MDSYYILLIEGVLKGTLFVAAAKSLALLRQSGYAKSQKWASSFSDIYNACNI
jgi:hypothetical protein